MCNFLAQKIIMSKSQTLLFSFPIKCWCLLYTFVKTTLYTTTFVSFCRLFFFREEKEFIEQAIDTCHVVITTFKRNSYFNFLKIFGNQFDVIKYDSTSKIYYCYCDNKYCVGT